MRRLAAPSHNSGTRPAGGGGVCVSRAAVRMCSGSEVASLGCDFGLHCFGGCLRGVGSERTVGRGKAPAVLRSALTVATGGMRTPEGGRKPEQAPSQFPAHQSHRGHCELTACRQRHRGAAAPGCGTFTLLRSFLPLFLFFETRYRSTETARPCRCNLFPIFAVG